MGFPPMFQIHVYSHFFKVVNPDHRAIQALVVFAKKYTTFALSMYGKTKGKYVADKVFAVNTQFNTEFRFHIGQLEEFQCFLRDNHITQDMVSYTFAEPAKGDSIQTQLLPNWELRDYQLEVRDFIVTDSDSNNNSRLVSIQTGKGKTVSALSCIPILGKRTAIAILPSYMEKWGSDISKVLNVNPKEILMVQGSKSLKGLIDAGLDGDLKVKFIIFSITTLRNYYKTYEEDPSKLEEEGYNCKPEDLFPTLGIGTLIIDEVHQQLHAVYKILTYTHVSKVIALSATFISKNQTIRKIQHLMFPREMRFDNLGNDKYIKAYAIAYAFTSCDASYLQTSERGNPNYSHNAFEKSLMRMPNVLKGYMKMIEHYINQGYLADYQKGDKLMVFASSINLCTAITEYLKTRYPDLDTRRYCEDDPYENVIEPDIRVSTIISSGTAIDIPQLTCTIMTVSVDSPVANIQALGRLREIRNRDVRFFYMYCSQIPKQVYYHRNKRPILIDKVATLKEFTHPFPV